MVIGPQRSHCVSAECAVSARRAYEFLLDGRKVGRWALGSFDARTVGPNLFRGRSLFDGAEVHYRPVGDLRRMMVDYHVGSNPRALVPRVMARVVPRDSRSCLVVLVAWRDATMSDARWDRLIACHEVEIRLIQAQLTARKRRDAARKRRDAARKRRT